MIISTTEIQNNFGKYLKLVGEEDIIIARHGKKVARLEKYFEGEDFLIKEGAYVYSYVGREIPYEKFLEIVQESHNCFEYIEGKVYQLPSPTYEHQKALREIITNFNLYFKEKKEEPIISPFPITLYKEEDQANVLMPDILVLPEELDLTKEEAKLTIPKLVVEIMSEKSRSIDLIKKLDIYRASGINEYWIVNPDTKEIYVYVFAKQDIQEMISYKGKEAAISNIFQGLEVDLSLIFNLC